MALVAYNRTVAPVLLVGTSVTLKASPVAGTNGQGNNVTDEFKNLSGAQFAALQAQANPGTGALVVVYQWTGLQEFPTPGLVVNNPSDLVANDDFFIWAGASATDPVPSVPPGVVGAAGTAAAPTTLDDALARLPPTWAKKCELNILPGTYSPLLVGGFGGSGNQLPGASSRVVIGDFTNEITDVVCSAADANGRNITYASLVPDTTTLTDNPLPVWAAAGTITAVAKAALLDNEGFVLNDGLNPAVNFEFKVTGAFQSKAALPRAVVDVSGATDAASVAVIIAAAINSTASAVQPNPLAITAATPVGAVVSLTNDKSGTAGNVAITETVADAGFLVTGMTLGVATTVVNVTSTALFDSEGFFQIDSEIFMYTGKTATSFTGVTRAVRNTVQASHVATTTVTRLDKYRGYSVSIIVAGVIQQSREITAVSATGQIDVRSKFSPVPTGSVSIFRIEKPAVKININATTPLFPDGITLWGQKGIQWAFTAGVTLGFADGSFNVSSDGVWITGLSNAVRGTVNVVRQGKIAGGANTALWLSQYSAGTNPFSATRQRGTYMRYVNWNMSEYGEVLNGQFVLDDVLTDFIDGSFDFTAPSFNRSSLQLTRGTTGNVRWDGTANPIPAIWTGSDPGSTDQIFMSEGCVMRRLDGNIQMENSLGNAIAARAAIIRDLGTAGATINLTGKNAAARGLVLQLGAQVQRWNNQGTTLTGFNGEVRNGSSGAAPTRTWADIRTSFPTAQASVGGNLFPASRPAFLAPVKQTFTALTAADTFDITLLGTGLGGIAGNVPALAITALRVTAGAAAAVGSYAVADVAATPLSPAASTIVGLATLSDNGKTLTFLAGSNVTAFVLEYVPADLSRYDTSIFINNS